MIRDKHGCLTRLRGVLSEMARERMLSGWQGGFRAVVWELLPVKELAEHFSPDTGCPTQELPSMAGLVFLADFFVREKGM